MSASRFGWVGWVYCATGQENRKMRMKTRGPETEDQASRKVAWMLPSLRTFLRSHTGNANGNPTAKLQRESFHFSCSSYYVSTSAFYPLSSYIYTAQPIVCASQIPGYLRQEISEKFIIQSYLLRSLIRQVWKCGIRKWMSGNPRITREYCQKKKRTRLRTWRQISGWQLLLGTIGRELWLIRNPTSLWKPWSPSQEEGLPLILQPRQI